MTPRRVPGTSEKFESHMQQRPHLLNGASVILWSGDGESRSWVTEGMLAALPAVLPQSTIDKEPASDMPALIVT